MYIRWSHQCFLCSNPIGFHIEPESEYEWLAYSHYRYIINPIPLFMNRMYLKYIGKRMRRLCAHCFLEYKPIPFRTLRDREIGRTRVVQKRSRSVTLEVLQKWLKDMPRFFYPDDFYL